MKYKIMTSLLASALTLGGCPTISTVRTSVDKEFQFADVQRVVPGMKESEVITLLGRPKAFGMDEQGKRYLIYQVTKISGTTGSISTPLAMGATTSVASRGFELRIQIRNALVDRVAYKNYAPS
jgi:hypothetical protein